jgi:hypothetical protein
MIGATNPSFNRDHTAAATSRHVCVNNGTALWPGFALRLGRPSELTRITLRRSI